MERPYLSIVVASRNDNHGDNMHKLMQMTLSTNIELLETNKIKSEVILIDYNPPPDRPLIKEILSMPKQAKYCTVRTIIVPPIIHQQLKDSDKIPFNGAVAQNVGIRRSRGMFVLSTPIDNIFSNEFFEFIAQKKLRGDSIYRSDRLNVSRKVLKLNSLDDILSFCSNNVIAIGTRYGAIPIIRKKKKHLRSKNINFDLSREKLPRLLHTKGPDLLLMSRESWHSLHGFPEMDCLSLHVDGFLCYMAYLSGIKEEILPESCRDYHIDHDSRWKNTHLPLYEKILFYCFPDVFARGIRWVFRRIRGSRLISIILREGGKLERIGITPVSWESILEILYEMKNGKRPIAYNDNNWGLGEEKMEEYYILKANWEK